MAVYIGVHYLVHLEYQTIPVDDTLTGPAR
jgi:hypothetical protein